MTLSAGDGRGQGSPNRQSRRQAVREHRRRARVLARARGCTCQLHLVLAPSDGRPVWAERPDTGKPIYLTRHRPGCPLLAEERPYGYVIIRPAEGRTA